MNLSQVVEALLFSAQRPLTPRELAAALRGAGAEDELAPNEFAKTTETEVATALEQLKIEYLEQQRAFQLLEKADGWQLTSDPQFARWVRQLFPAAKPARLTPPALETLAIIAYRQPITRAEIEAVRGVAVNSNIIGTVIERGWVRVVGHRDVPGHPELLGTTREFLDYFGLKSLDELPPLAQLQAIGDLNLQLALPSEEGAAEHLPAAASDEALEADENGDEDELSAEGSGSSELVAAPPHLVD
jgi:segregation and condensation protein B